MTEEFGRERAEQSGIAQWAKINSGNSERDVHRLVKKQQTKLEVPITEINIQETLMPWISPKAWLQYLISHGLLYMLSGLQFEQRHLLERTWQEFWVRYEGLHPGFSLFSMEGISLKNTIALYLHGDEGRTLKKHALMVTSLQSVLGNGFSSRRKKRPREQDRLQVNFAGHTHLTRFVCSVVPKAHYQGNPSFFQDMMKELGKELKILLTEGIVDPITGILWRFAVIGIKGDMPYLQKVGNLRRSWNTGIKRGSERKAARGVCHLCLAGQANFPCEDTADLPCWLPTVGVRVPWDSKPPILDFVPHDESHPGNFFKPDVWHCVQLGIGKSFLSSTLQVALEVVPGANNDARFDWLTSHYLAWCKQNKKRSFVNKISAYLISMGDSTGAVGNWSKGSVTTSLMLWLVPLIDELGPDSRGWLARCKQAAKSLNTVLIFLYNAPLFLEQDECVFVVKHGMGFLQAYTGLARDAFHENKPHLWPLVPKVHSFHHTWDFIRSDCAAYQYSMNPFSASCQLDEDTVGRISRVSRRVNIRLCAQRTLQRHLMACWGVWREAGVLR